ncbi:MAG: TM2 domain-containing protein [Treponema sp.]|jgi:TM2 domain-containing membrane protein YozV|nr:TM2 domain-containing protein [Treponema sp.]
MSDVQETKVEKKENEKYCSSCGAIIKKEAVICPKCGVQQKNMDGDNDVSKKWLTTLLLCIFLGTIGGHNFYVGKTKKGILMLVLLVAGIVFAAAIVGFAGIALVFVLWVVDLIKILSGTFTDGAGNVIKKE